EDGAEPTHLAEQVALSHKVFEAAADAPAELLGAGAKGVRPDLVQHRDRRGACDRIAAERPPEAARRDGVHHLGLARHASEWEASAERFPAHQEVWLNTVVLDRPDRTCPSGPRLHLVVDVEDPVLVANLLQ